MNHEITINKGKPVHTMKALHLTALLLAAGVAAFAQGTTNEAAAVAHALQIEAARGTNADGFCFLSLQHPEWPPMPTSPDPKLEVVRVGVGTYLVDDANWVYPKPPAVATNVAAQKRVQLDADFELATNHIAANPALTEHYKRMTFLLFPTNNLSKGEAALVNRRLLRTLAEIDRIAQHSVSNEYTLSASTVAALTNTPQIKEVK